MAGNFAFAKAGTTTTREVAFMEYNVWNQMVKTIDGDKTLTYRYNGEGYRIEKAVNGQITRYMYEADKVILELDVQGNETAKNTYGTGIISRTADNETAYYMYNGHGDVTALLGDTGNVLATYYYDAFGNITEQTGEADNPIRYAGYQYDEETGIYYLNARYYDPKIARFLTEDTYRGEPSDPLSLNLYTYCNNEPMMYTDPTGHFPWLEIIIGTIIGIVGGGSGGGGNDDDDNDDDDDDDNDRGRGGSSNNNSGGNQANKPKKANENGKILSGLANMIKNILAKIESMRYPVNVKNTHNVTGPGENASNSFVIEYGPATAYAGDDYASWMFPKKVPETAPNTMAVNTGDASVDVALTKWLDTNPQLRYGNDPRYDIFSVTSFQSKLLHYSKSGKDVSTMSIEELDKEFEQELSDHADGIMGMAAAVFAKAVQAVKSAAKAVVTKGTSSAYSNFAKQATKNANSTEVVLGKFNQGGVSYTKVAEQRGATYFQLDNWDNVVKKVGEKNIWNINESFIRQQASANKTFILSHDPAQATGYFANEVNLLKNMGYSFTQEGSIWRAIK